MSGWLRPFIKLTLHILSRVNLHNVNTSSLLLLLSFYIRQKRRSKSRTQPQSEGLWPFSPQWYGGADIGTLEEKSTENVAVFFSRVQSNENQCILRLSSSVQNFSVGSTFIVLFCIDPRMSKAHNLLGFEFQFPKYKIKILVTICNKKGGYFK